MGLVHAVGLVLHPERDASPAIDAVVKWARARDVDVLGLTEEVGRLRCGATPIDAVELADRADLLISLGGDGTMLRSMALVTGRRTPVLGVNLGRLGFLAEIDVGELSEALTAIDEHRYTVEPRMAIRTILPNGAAVTAFNDIALVRVPGHGSAAVAISVLGRPFVRYSADAVLVATTTGSTAYSFSAGGPIVSPRVDAVLVVAAAAHSTFDRALVLPADEQPSLEVLPVSGRLAVEVDGRVAGYAVPGDRLDVTTVRAAAQVIRLGRASFYERARRKLQVSGSLEVE
ncbi:NAD(+)/NADH kinase [Actinopolymorpha pittospori]|uniref:NAD kinase n=1 Tax=Actinopolymorpha pittospori TaxID=648752 RepID=A0A927RLY9_9ACTN|nr:NAD(+)/NADH kinase [Actinopolymorpha pittospori]MBE1609676.1 NAD+ kinase [Actinopolymorpha pittospori]